MDLGLFTSLRTAWRTPKALRDALTHEFGPLFDPAPAMAGQWDGLLIPWPRLVFVNPPYGLALPTWLRKGEEEFNAGRTNLAVWLLPARTDTAWFHDIVLPRSTEIRFLRNRLRFDDGPGRAPFPSMISVWKRES